MVSKQVEIKDHLLRCIGSISIFFLIISKDSGKGRGQVVYVDANNQLAESNFPGQLIN